MPSDVKIRVYIRTSRAFLKVWCAARWADPCGGEQWSDNFMVIPWEKYRIARHVLPYMRDSASRTFWRSVISYKVDETWWEIEYPYEVTMDELRNPIDLIGGWPDIEGELEWAESHRDNDGFKLKWKFADDYKVFPPVTTRGSQCSTWNLQ